MGLSASAVNYAVGPTPSGITTADFNGDGILDLATANQGSNDVTVLLGDGLGGFITPGNTYSAGSTPVMVTHGDFNRDGKIDLAVANYSAVRCLFFWAMGMEPLALKRIISAGGNLQGIITADLDGDGDLDLAVTNYGANQIYVLTGNGDGSFAPAVSYTVGNSPRFLTAGDFNRDGRLDLCVPNSASNTISILFGKGDGTFNPAVDYATGPGSSPVSVVAGDFNHDGDLDLAVTSSGNGNVSIFQNDTCTPAPSGLVSWWRAEGDARDFWDGNHGSLQNGATFAAGKVGQAFSFDGINDYLFPYLIDPVPQFHRWLNISVVLQGCHQRIPQSESDPVWSPMPSGFCTEKEFRSSDMGKFYMR